MSEYINNRAKRKETLKSIIKELHEGKSVDEVKQEFATLLGDVGASEIAEIEQTLIDEGLPEMEVKRLCDVHVAVFRDSLEAQDQPETIPGHPVHTFRTENVVAGTVLDALQEALAALRETTGAAQLAEARERLHRLREYEKHYLRKENILFPYLERHHFMGPSTVMWAIHDDIRTAWKALDELLVAGPGDDSPAFNARIAEIFEPLNTAIREMFFKEENILFPTALEKLGNEEWVAIRAQEDDIGYFYVKPEDEWQPATTVSPVAPAPPADEARPAGAEVGAQRAAPLLHLDTGVLTVREVNLLLTHLPVDITYVDKDDTVRFFSQTKERIFPRSPAIIGRKVQKCHPPASLDRVQRIVDDFRAGRRDEAEFWIQREGLFVHIRYFALRDDTGEYQGTIEVTQEVSHIRALEGERRLLDDAK